MPKVKKLRKGLNIKLFGEAEKITADLHSDSYAVKPVEFLGVFPKLLVSEGDLVQAGSPLFFDKYREKIKFTSPVSGKVTEIRRGAKRVLEMISIESDGKDAFVSFAKGNPSDLRREDIIKTMLDAGVWAFMRQRPYAIVANPDETPKAIFISAFDTSPLAPDVDYLLDGQEKYFQAGLDALAKLTPGKVHLGLHPTGSISKAITQAKGVQLNYFDGPHPAGNVGIQIHHTDPVNKGEVVWYMSPADVVVTGKLFLEGRYDTTGLVALTGSEVKNPRYYRTRRGANIAGMIRDNLLSSNVRIISGNVLHGTAISRDGYLNHCSSHVTIIPEGDYYEFFGWALPGFGKFSTSRSFFSWLTPGRKFKMDTNLHGGHRAFVMSGEYERVLPMDILPVHLLKAILVDDIDKMENLGIYEVAEEDFALCEFVCTSKTNVQEILRNGLDYLRKELS